ncbi:gliding motility-associated protein GldE [Pontibacter sp. G13]|uniref:gliding motility-associated protein GldE n=1 Tax=Pontibacter sp. G13 TaxID=3074898 RepID=UPI00288B9F12|nr:gliding motility-associated protein GldE [Pontibacter sp. G13]WNJ20820.1 gliding motility-associated protein GldE [Pontibacter sp. G13]
MDPDPGNFLLSFTILDAWPLTGPQMLQIGAFIVLIVLSFMASGAEVAYFSLTKPEIDEFKEADKPEGKRVWNLISEPKKLLATILITNNFVNVAAILVASAFLRDLPGRADWNPQFAALIEVVVITALLLFFGEIIPKVFAAKNRITLVKLLSWPLWLLKKLLSPLAQMLIRGTSIVEKRVKLKEEQVSLDDLRHAISLTSGGKAEETEEEENGNDEILKGIVNFSNIAVKSVMRARVNVIAVDISMPFQELLDFIRENNYSRLPVYDTHLDNIKGLLHVKDLLPYLKEDSKPFKFEDILRDAYFIPESKKIDTLLEEFKTQHLHMAIVVDEFGGTAGIVTLEDVIEEIFGEINDEFDSQDWVYSKLSDDTYIFEGRISLNDVRKIVGLDEDVFEDARGDNDSLGGLILELHGKIPAVGEIITYKHYQLHVEAVSKKRITMVKFVIMAQELSE